MIATFKQHNTIMTNSRKIEILKGALERIKDGRDEYMCHAIGSELTSQESHSYERMSSAGKMLYFGIKRPSDARVCAWFDTDEHGIQRRIEILTKRIKELQGDNPIAIRKAVK